MITFLKKTFNKAKKGKLKGFETKSNNLVFGFFGLKSLTSKKIKLCQIESLRKIFEKKIMKTCKFWFRIFPTKAIFKKTVDSRMGKGKGFFNFFCVPIKSGTVLLEISGISYILAKKINKFLKNKLCVLTKLISLYD